MNTAPPLLQLAEGRKVRPRKAGAHRPKELELHLAVATVMRDHCLPEWLWTHVPTGEHRDIRTAAKLKAMGARRGWPDFILVSPDGSVRFLELKRLGKKLSDDQSDFRVHCIKHGIWHRVAWTIDEALAALDECGCLRIKLT